MQQDDLFAFDTWDEVTAAIKEIRDRCNKLEAEAAELSGAIPVNRLKELVLIKKRINQLDKQFDMTMASLGFLKTIPKAGAEADALASRFDEMYKSFKTLKRGIEKAFLEEKT